jgi:protein-S-isoprenylcysteine O-methyltransferase Ste14
VVGASGRRDGPLTAQYVIESSIFGVVIEEQMWIIRFILLGVLGASSYVDHYLYRHRSRYERLLENRIYNVTGVIVWNCLCYLIVGLPPAGGWNLRPDWLGYRSVYIGFSVIGSLLICAGALLAFATLRQRKVIGVEAVKEGLLTSGFYRYFRHPIYTGIMWISLGLPLVMRNLDGLLMFPAIFVIHFAAAMIEERNDMCVRFREQYQAYRQTTRMFGPIWLWGALVFLLSVVIALGSP